VRAGCCLAHPNLATYCFSVQHFVQVFQDKWTIMFHNFLALHATKRHQSPQSTTMVASTSSCICYFLVPEKKVTGLSQRKSILMGSPGHDQNKKTQASKPPLYQPWLSEIGRFTTTTLQEQLNHLVLFLERWDPLVTKNYPIVSTGHTLSRNHSCGGSRCNILQLPLWPTSNWHM